MIQKYKEVTPSRPTKYSFLYEKKNSISKILKIEPVRVLYAIPMPFKYKFKKVEILFKCVLPFAERFTVYVT